MLLSKSVNKRNGFGSTSYPLETSAVPVIFEPPELPGFSGRELPAGLQISAASFLDTQGMKSPLVQGVALPMQSLNNDIICNKGFAKAHPKIVADHRKASLILIGECIPY